MQTGSSPCLTAGERSKLLGILSRLESPFDGERAAAALLASRMLRAKNLQWDSLIAVPDVREAPTDRTLIQWRNDLSICLICLVAASIRDYHFRNLPKKTEP